MNIIKCKVYFLLLSLWLGNLSIGLCSIGQSSKDVFFVSINGSDNYTGSKEMPFHTLAKAIASLPDSEVPKIIYLREGTYFIQDSLVINQITNLEIKNYQNETVKLVGGRNLPLTCFKKLSRGGDYRKLPIVAKGKVYTLNLVSMGITEFGELKKTGFGSIRAAASLELFENNQALPLAQWPNKELLLVDSVYQTETKSDQSNAVFTYAGSQRNWNNSNDIWVSGFFSVGWAFDNLPVSLSDKEAGKVKVLPQDFSSYGIYTKKDKSTGILQSAAKVRGFYFYNILEELDQPGEWYLDRKTGDLYVWPSTHIEEAVFQVTVNKAENLINLNKCSNVLISGLDFSLFRGSVFNITNSQDITIAYSEFQNIGVSAIKVNQSKRVDINNVLIQDTGSTAIILSGGNRKTLEPAHNRINHAEISGFGRRYKSYAPAVSLSGVGNSISNCYLHTSTSHAILFNGNDHLIENNHIRNAANGFNDTGAIYTGRDPSSTGTLIRNNLFEDIGTDTGKAVAALYFDDGASGFQVYGNIFYNCGHSTNPFGAVHIHGGGDNVFTNNIFADTYRAFSNTPWTVEKWKNVYFDNKVNWDRLYKAVDIGSDVYTNKYPWLKGFDDLDNIQERSNTIIGTLTFKVSQFNRGDRNLDISQTYNLPANSQMERVEDIYQFLPLELLKNKDFNKVKFDYFGRQNQ
ncbi:right-handed parallel beta-helix repeat-containing protein [Anditalea andensis]|uniref:Uncharacterized protein n=1 Tax=Anditalea andensis TaxID=1048983 RepID=A0A074KPE5_9BACT|nr:right-handed parallel beta-helix repeat-containing protein [Anditalea andensis]KEO71826.1 hypothetical protein EL17_21130 [Anditalea andensis]